MAGLIRETATRADRRLTNCLAAAKLRFAEACIEDSRAIARELAAGVIADYGPKYDSAVACFIDDFEACIAHLQFP